MVPKSKLNNTKRENEITTSFNKKIIDENRKETIINNNVKKKSNKNINKLNYIDKNKDNKTTKLKEEKALKRNGNFKDKKQNLKNKNLIDKDNKMNKAKTQIKKINDNKNNTNNIQKDNEENKKVYENNINNKNNEKNTIIISENIDNIQNKICKSCILIKRKKYRRIKRCYCLVHRAMNKKLDSINKKNNIIQCGKTIKNKKNHCIIISQKKKSLLIIGKTFREEFSNEAKKNEMHIEKGFRKNFYSIKKKDIDYKTEKNELNIIRKKNIIEHKIEKNDFKIIKEKKVRDYKIEKNECEILSPKKIFYFQIENNDFTILRKRKIIDYKIEKNECKILRAKNNPIPLKEKKNESLLTQDTSSELDKTIKLPETPKGLKNFALNCYMNSLLQCFYHIKGLRTSFIENSFSKETQKVCFGLSEVMHQLAYGNDTNYSANNFKNILGDINQIFKGTKGADITDLYRTIVDAIIEEIPYEYPEDEDENDDGDNTNKEKIYKIAKKEVNENNPIIKELNYYFETIYFCPKGYKCYSIQNDTSIILELLKISKWAKSKKLDLNKCFEYHFRVADENKFYCSKCEKVHNSKSIDKIISLPKVLTLILNRGKDKLFENHVKFDEIINIEKYVDDTFIEKKNKKYKYKLIGVSTHTGSSSECGHYYSYCYRENEKKYYLFNDTIIRPVNKKEYLYDGSGEAYILFYEQIL